MENQRPNFSAMVVVPVKTPYLCDPVMCCQEHTRNMLNCLPSLGIDVVIQPCPSAPLDQFRSELLERAFTVPANWPVIIMLDSDCSASLMDIRALADRSLSDQSSGIPSVRACVYPHKPVDGGPSVSDPVGTGLEDIVLPPLESIELTPKTMLGLGCCAINRAAWEVMCDKNPLTVRCLTELEIHPLFRTAIIEGRWFSEDYSFFMRAFASGVRVFLEPVRVAHGEGGLESPNVNTLW